MENDANPSCLISSNSLDGNIVDNPDDSSYRSISTILNYCKSKILIPYTRLLSLTGLRPLRTAPDSTWIPIINNFYTLHVICLLLLGYLLQYMACFRRDRGFCYYTPSNHTYFFQEELSRQIHERICRGPLLFSFIIPSCLHFFGYLYALYTLRKSEEDQLPILVETIFLSSNSQASQRKLLRILWLFIIFTAIWMGLSLIGLNFMMGYGTITFRWLESSDFSPAVTTLLKFFLVLCTLWHDIIQTMIISNYCLQVQLLCTYLQSLQEKLLQCPVQPLEWIRHIETFKKMLIYLNNEIAPSVSLFTFTSICWAVSGLIWLLNYDNIDKQTTPIVGVSTLNEALWIFVALIPFVQASRLSNECKILRNAGQEIRTRPFVRHSGDNLDSILLYTASLQLRARLFCIPITGKYLWLFFMLVGLCVVVLGQCHFFN